MGTWRVGLGADGRWQVRTPGCTQSCVRDSREQAVDAAGALAQVEGGGIILVENAHGELEYQHTVLYDEPHDGFWRAWP